MLRHSCRIREPTRRVARAQCGGRLASGRGPASARRGSDIAISMVHLLNLLAAVALLVWGTQIVRTGILRVFGENLRHVRAFARASRM